MTAHSNYFRMVKLDLVKLLSKGEIEKQTLVELGEEFIENSNFTGLTGLFNLIDKIQFTQQDSQILFQTYYRFSERVYQVDLVTKQLKCIVPELKAEG